MRYLHTFFALVAVVCMYSCGPKAAQQFPADHPAIRYSGRIDFEDEKNPVFISSGALVELAFSGDSCAVLLKKLNSEGEHNYVSLELDGEYLGRVKLESDSLEAYPVKVKHPLEKHVLRVFKSTEAQNGNVAFGGVRCMELRNLPPLPERKIEFIGNSITCGMGIAWKEIPCDAGVWYDQHDAYLAYGPRVAKALDATFMLSSVSGIGVYRNWNSLSPTMPEVYDRLNLNDGKKYNFEMYKPDLVSIALGTNDFSDGDGVKERLPFDSARFVTNYIEFVETIYSNYPGVQVALLTSPMVSGEKGRTFLNCLHAVKEHFLGVEPEGKEIAVFNFTSIEPHGCGYHPDSDDHEKMAEQLIPFYKSLMEW